MSGACVIEDAGQAWFDAKTLYAKAQGGLEIEGDAFIHTMITDEAVAIMEESFRDLKSERFGLGFQASRWRKILTIVLPG